MEMQNIRSMLFDQFVSLHGKAGLIGVNSTLNHGRHEVFQ